jgi:hypothetical protein
MNQCQLGSVTETRYGCGDLIGTRAGNERSQQKSGSCPKSVIEVIEVEGF